VKSTAEVPPPDRLASGGDRLASGGDRLASSGDRLASSGESHLRTASNLTLAWVGASKAEWEYTAATAGHLAVVRALLDAGADYTVQQRRRLLRVERTSSLARGRASVSQALLALPLHFEPASKQ
jgi:hypothetical protein